MAISNVRGVILAAGKSTRFKTEKCKLIFTVCGQPMILFPIKILKDFNIPITVVLGFKKDEIKSEIKKSGINSIDFVVQENQMGTGNAVKSSQKTWDRDNILIINGDAPLITDEIIKELVEEHNKKKATLTFISAHCFNPSGYGRVIKDKDKLFIVEEKNCTDEQRTITLINAGIYLVSKDFLANNLDKIKKNPVSGEYYITDLVEVASKQNVNVQTIQVPYDNVRGVNNLEELWVAEQIKRSQMIKYWMSRGVRFELAQNIHLDLDIQIGEESFIGTGVHVLRGTKIGKKCTINAFSIIENTKIDDNSHIHSHSVIQDSVIGKNVHVGPFARLRNNVILGDNSTIGNFVEIKNTQIDDNTKTRHLTFLGDTSVGKNVNIGAGTITCNFDGVKKNKTIIEDNCFIGSNNTLIAPVKIGKNSYTAGGSAISGDVPQNTLAIGRSRQKNKVGYTKKLKDKKRQNQSSNKNKNEKSNNNLKINFIGAVKTDKIQENV
ncbi:bifunctional UDP-N-acetylglucosamine diphosphorylase/glucosamine-1-phosphate N-acetyltransferase GlmU [Candidatus Babeliales bacterium]|nr:bifunctional UDP-N-acetylglucosamine diphosphorylase/glucosamine-1-phosphate N-acetyltransferase GlmU [Candidatus Babeliales bacterium]